MLAVIPAAGRGTRMGELTNDLPKPMLPLWGKPVLGHILSELRKADFREVVLIVGYGADAIRSYVKRGEEFGLRVDYVFQEKPLGTAHAIGLAKNLLARHQNFFVQFADIIISAQWYQRLYFFLTVAGPTPLTHFDGIVTLERGDYSQGAAVILDEKWLVKRIIEKPAPGSVETEWNNAGVMLLSSSALELFSENYEENKDAFFSTVVDAWIQKGAHVAGAFIPPEWYFDVKNREVYENLKRRKRPNFLR